MLFNSNICFLCCFLSGIAEANQEHIMVQGGISLLATTAADADDAQTLRMVAGAIANLCGNGILPCLFFISSVKDFLFLFDYSLRVACDDALLSMNRRHWI